MIIVMQPHSPQEDIQYIVSFIESAGLQAHLSKGEEVTIIGVVGDKSRISSDRLKALESVDKIVPVTESYKLVNKKFHPDPTVVQVGSTSIGPGNLTIIAGPCAVEKEEQVMIIAKEVKAAGATMIRGGAYKPRTSPYSFQGLEENGLKIMKQASLETGLPCVCEVIDIDSINAAVKYVDMLQIGARNMQNFILLKEVGQSKLPVLLKRGLCATIDEWLNAAEYIISEGNPNVVLCERGIRTYETATRNTLDLSCVPVLRERTHLPVLVDPSHSTGSYKYVPSMAKAAVACDADGMIIEVHNNPACALSDGPQSLNFKKFSKLCQELKPYAELAGRKFGV